MSRKLTQPNRTKNNNTPYVNASDIFGSEDDDGSTNDIFSPPSASLSTPSIDGASSARAPPQSYTRKRRADEELPRSSDQNFHAHEHPRGIVDRVGDHPRGVVNRVVDHQQRGAANRVVDHHPARGVANNRVATPPPKDFDEAMADLGEATPVFDRLSYSLYRKYMYL